MLLLLVRRKGNKFGLLCPETYGSETWGGYTQRSLEKARKNWYDVYWEFRGLEEEEYTEKTKINVVFESKSICEVLNYVADHNKKEIKHIIKDYEALAKHYIDFIKWLYEPRED